jgi:hypothetical protein
MSSENLNSEPTRECYENVSFDWDFDFKQKLLGNNYDNYNPIKNILLMKNNPPGRHIENDPIVDTIFKKLFPQQDNKKSYKDIMNSFWTTYKFHLQIEYPEIFTPGGICYNDKTTQEYKPPDFASDPSARQKYPPYDTEEYMTIRSEYITHYESKFKGEINIPNKTKIIIPGTKRTLLINPTWCELLIENFDYFDKVHQCGELHKFAKLTHTIGNVLIVTAPEFKIPSNFNYITPGIKNSFDYCDLKLELLKKTLGTLWKQFVDSHYLNDYVDENDNVIPLWKNHLVNSSLSPKNNGNQIPKTSDQILEFLSNVNCRIEKRGKDIINKLCEHLKNT